MGLYAELCHGVTYPYFWHVRVGPCFLQGVQDLLNSLYDEVDVRVDTSVPQFTLEGSILLLITGVMTRKVGVLS